MRRLTRRNTQRVSIFKEVEETPTRFSGQMCPTNLEEQKEKFLKHGVAPKFKMRESASTLERMQHKKRGHIRFELFDEARRVLEKVRSLYGDGSGYLEAAYGKRIDYVRATEILADHLNENGAAGEITVYWAAELTCSARMMWHGPNTRYNRPEMRKYSLIIKNSSENALLRETGIRCLADHEIGTHYFRMINDGLQPWFSDRKKFGLRGLRCRESVASEEGLAAINTVLNAKKKYLWSSALLYYTACKADEMSFKELYDHLEVYVADPEQRWKHVMRVKRCLQDPNGTGGYGNDQCYFEGAVQLLRNIEKTDFFVMYAGKVCIDETHRVRRLARMNCIRTPKFLRDMEKYKKTLRTIAYVNGLIPKPEFRRIPSLVSQSAPPGPHPAKKPTSAVDRKRSKSRRKTSAEFELLAPSPPPPPLKHAHHESLPCHPDQLSAIQKNNATYVIREDEDLQKVPHEDVSTPPLFAQAKLLSPLVPAPPAASSTTHAFTRSTHNFIYPSRQHAASMRASYDGDDLDARADESDGDYDEDEDEEMDRQAVERQQTRLLNRSQRRDNRISQEEADSEAFSWSSHSALNNMDYFSFVENNSKS